MEKTPHILLVGEGAKWFALQGTPWSKRAVMAEADAINKGRLIAALRAEISDLKGALESYESEEWSVS